MLVETTIRKPTMGFSQLQKYGRDLHLDLHLGYIYVHHISSAIPYNTSASFSKKQNHNSFFFLVFLCYFQSQSQKLLGANSEAKTI